MVKGLSCHQCITRNCMSRSTCCEQKWALMW